MREVWKVLKRLCEKGWFKIRRKVGLDYWGWFYLDLIYLVKELGREDCSGSECLGVFECFRRLFICIVCLVFVKVYFKFL